MDPSPPTPRLSRRRLLGTAAAIGAGAATAGLTGCSSPTSISADPSELVLWYWNRSITPSLLDQAAQQIPGSQDRKLRADVIGGTFDTKLRTSLAGGAYIPDITGINSNCSLYFLNEDQFLDFNELGGRELADQYYPWKVKLGTTPSGRHCFWPMDTGPTGLYYRADLFEEAGLPSDPEEVGAATTTWEDLIELGVELRRGGEGPALIGYGFFVFSQFLNASPERYFDEQDRPLYSRPDSAVRRAWDTAVMAMEAGVTGNRQTSTDQNAAWTSGDTAAHIEAAWWAEVLADTAPDTSGNWRIASQPVNPGNSGGSFLAIPATCKDPEAAFAFATWLTSPENQTTAFNEIQLFPSTPSSFESGQLDGSSDFFGSQDRLTFFSEAAAGVPTTYVSSYEAQVSAFGSEIKNVETGKPAEQAWADAVDAADRTLRKRGVLL